MNKSELFLNLVRLGIGNYSYEFSNDIDWQSIQFLAQKQELLGVVMDGIERLPVGRRPSQELMLEWIGEVLQGYEFRYELYRRTIAEMADFYNSRGFKMMIVKGYVCSANWPKPEHRPCGDIDMWLFGRQKQADILLSKEKSIKVDNSHHHHTVHSWGEFTVENYYDFTNVHYHKISIALERVLKDLASDDSHYVFLLGKKLYLPSPNLHALLLLDNAMTDFAAFYVTLRQVLDWAFHVQKYHKEIDWIWLLGVLEEFHMVEFFNCINAICVEDLGFDANVFHKVQFNPFLKEKVLADILNPKFAREEPNKLWYRLAYKYNRWKGNAWKRKMCYNETMWSAFWSGAWSHLLKPASI